MVQTAVNIGTHDSDWDSVEQALRVIDTGFRYSADRKLYYPYWAIKVRRDKNIFRRKIQHEINMLVDAQHGNLTSVDVFPENKTGCLPENNIPLSLSVEEASRLVMERMPRKKFSMVFTVEILSSTLLYLPLWVINCESKNLPDALSAREAKGALKILFDPGTGKYVSFANE